MDLENGVDLFLDSGAFSAASQGAEIDIYEYIEFIKRHEHLLTAYANLDVIGDPAKGVDGAKGTLENQRVMESEGLSPIPVFHVGEDEYYLQYYADNYEYIGLGGMVPFSSQALRTWLGRIFRTYICDSRGWPQVKVHGFGMTSLSLMLRYPWFSVDSTSWILTSRNGGIYVPRKRNGDWIYDENSWKVAVSARSPQAREAGQHYDSMTPRRQAIVREYVESKGYRMGKSRFEYVNPDYKPGEGEKWAAKPDPESGKRLLEIIEEPGIRNQYKQRDELCVIYFLDLEEHFPYWPWPMDVGTTTGFGL